MEDKEDEVKDVFYDHIDRRFEHFDSTLLK